MTDQSGGGDPGDMGDDDSPTVPVAAVPGTDAGTKVEHSPLVGFMSVPVHRRLPVRRSTFLMAVAFLGLGALLYFNPPSSTSGTGAIVRTPDGDYFLPGAVKVASSTTTTTTRPVSTTTTTTSTTTTTRPAPPTTIARPIPTTTTTNSFSATTTTVRGVGSTATTTTVRGVGATASTTTTPTSTTGAVG